MFPHVVRVMSGLKPTRGKIWTVPCTRKLSSSEAKLCLLLLASQKTACMLAFMVQSTTFFSPEKRKIENWQEVYFYTRTLEQEEALSSVPGEEKEEQVQKGAWPPQVTLCGTAQAQPPELNPGSILHPPKPDQTQPGPQAQTLQLGSTAASSQPSTIHHHPDSNTSKQSLSTSLKASFTPAGILFPQKKTPKNRKKPKQTKQLKKCKKFYHVSHSLPNAVPAEGSFLKASHCTDQLLLTAVPFLNCCLEVSAPKP